MIDDGSYDSTKAIVESYRTKFVSQNIALIYAFQENAGQAMAINVGLRMMTGDYFTWIDSDDFLLPTSIERRLCELKRTGEGFFCITQGKRVKEKKVDGRRYAIVRRIPPKENEKDDFFRDLIRDNNINFLSGGGTMIKTTDWLKACPKNELVSLKTVGQNWQLMLPMAYNYKCIYINEPLYVVVAHPDSHSRREITSKQYIEKKKNALYILYETIKEMNIVEEEEISKLIDDVHMSQIIKWSKKIKDKETIIEYYREYENKYGNDNLKLFKKKCRITLRTRLRWNIIIKRVIRILKY